MLDLKIAKLPYLQRMAFENSSEAQQEAVMKKLEEGYQVERVGKQGSFLMKKGSTSWWVTTAGQVAPV